MTTTEAFTNDQKVALITGANRGLGFATAQILGEAGITVLIGSRSIEAGEHAADRLRGDGIDAHAVQIDVTSEVSVRNAATDLAADHVQLDVLVNNAGILPESHHP